MSDTKNENAMNNAVETEQLNEELIMMQDNAHLNNKACAYCGVELEEDDTIYNFMGDVLCQSCLKKELRYQNKGKEPELIRQLIIKQLEKKTDDLPNFDVVKVLLNCMDNEDYDYIYDELFDDVCELWGDMSVDED